VIKTAAIIFGIGFTVGFTVKFVLGLPAQFMAGLRVGARDIEPPVSYLWPPIFAVNFLWVLPRVFVTELSRALQEELTARQFLSGR
jgi:hypothetical protein